MVIITTIIISIPALTLPALLIWRRLAVTAITIIDSAKIRTHSRYSRYGWHVLKRFVCALALQCSSASYVRRICDLQPRWLDTL
jgi:hypothetical protein